MIKHKEEIGIEILDFKSLVYVASLDEYVTADKVPAGEKPLSISGTKFRAMMNAGDPIPEWFSHPDVIKILRVCDILRRADDLLPRKFCYYFCSIVACQRSP